MAGKRELQNFVDGAFVGARDGASTDIVNPSTGEVFATAPQSGPGGCGRRLPGGRALLSTGCGGTRRQASGWAIC